MRLWAFPAPVTVIIDIFAWLAIHLGISALALRIPRDWFDASSGLFRARHWEVSGRIYERWFLIRRWKSHLPDAAPWFPGGLPKRLGRDRSAEALRTLAQETCRGEIAHWATLAAAPLFFLWNTGTVGIIMLIYAAGMNLPCILAQRYNRARLAKLL